MTPEEIVGLAHGMSAQDRAEIMRRLAFPASRKSTIVSLAFVTSPKSGLLVRIDLADETKRFLKRVAIARLVVGAITADRLCSDEAARFTNEELGEDEAAELLVGRNVVVDEYPSSEGVVCHVRVDNDTSVTMAREGGS